MGTRSTSVFRKLLSNSADDRRYLRLIRTAQKRMLSEAEDHLLLHALCAGPVGVHSAD